MIEIEKTYLVKSLPDNLKQFPSDEIIDIYIPKETEYPQLRIRKRNGTYEITKKVLVSEDDCSQQYEHTIELNEQEYQALAQLPGKRVHKMRYFFPYNGQTAEFGVFQGALEGLVLVDVEFEDAETKDAFTTPEFCLADVTDQMFVAGRSLADKTYADIENKLEEFGYKKLSL